MKKFNIPELITDTFIILFFTFDNNRINPARTKLKFIQRFSKIEEYLKNRYSDSESYLETIYRIINNIDIKPKCKYCGKQLSFDKSHHFMEYCSYKCIANAEEVKRKKQNTSNIRGIGNNIEKQQQTLFRKYGVYHALQSEQFIEKLKNTNKEKLNVEFPGQSEFCKKKIRNTCLEKYGVDHNFKIKGIRDNIKNTWLTKYNVDNPMKCSDIVNKNILSKRNNHTFNSSNKENELYNALIDLYGEQNIKRQYKSELYPFCCDFYLSAFDLYIELNLFWTHGKHPFDVNSFDDLQLLLKWNSKGYSYAVDTWTVRDVNKRNIAFQNNLNFIELYTNDVDDMIWQIQKFIQEKL